GHLATPSAAPLSDVLVQRLADQIGARQGTPWMRLKLGGHSLIESGDEIARHPDVEVVEPAVPESGDRCWEAGDAFAKATGPPEPLSSTPEIGEAPVEVLSSAAVARNCGQKADRVRR